MKSYLLLPKEWENKHILGEDAARDEAMRLAEIEGNPINVYVLVSEFYGKGGE